MFGSHLNIAVIGASGALGQAFVETLSALPSVDRVYAYARNPLTFASQKVICHEIDITSESSVEAAAAQLEADTTLDGVIVATGRLHSQTYTPEKNLSGVNPTQCLDQYTVNALGPILCAKYFIPKLVQDQPAVFAALSARVGSISDNRLGGWYSYRASKAALNMFLKTLSIEMQRVAKQMIVVGLHPGTVKSALSEPFQSGVKPENLFSAEYSVKRLLQVLSTLTPEDTGKLMAYDGETIPF